MLDQWGFSALINIKLILFREMLTRPEYLQVAPAAATLSPCSLSYCPIEGSLHTGVLAEGVAGWLERLLFPPRLGRLAV